MFNIYRFLQVFLLPIILPTKNAEEIAQKKQWVFNNTVCFPFKFYILITVVQNTFCSTNPSFLTAT